MGLKKITKKLAILNSNWIVINTKSEVLNFITDIYQKGIRQDADHLKYDKLSLAICYIYASYLYNGYELNGIKIECWRHASEFQEIILNSKEEVLKVITEELNEGKPVIAEINDKNGSHRFITIVGYKELRTKKTIEENDLLIIDSYDGKIKNIDGNNMYLVNGKEIDKYYEGYYLRIIAKNIDK